MKHIIIFALFLLVLSNEILAALPERDPMDYNRNILWKTSDQKNWYEWWYFKVIEPKTKKSFYFVYGLVNPWDAEQKKAGSKAYVGAGSFDQKMMVEENFLPNHFTKTDQAIIQIGRNNDFSEKYLRGDIVNEQGKRVRWYLETEFIWGYNAMDWSLFVENISSIYWYPVQAHMTMSGWIEFDGVRTELTKAFAYQDRNWGRSLPKWWAWLVSNNFKNSPGTVLAAGGGKPRFATLLPVNNVFTVGLRYQNKDYNWQLLHLDRFNVDINFGRWLLSAENKQGYRIEIDAFAPKEKFMNLPFTSPDGDVFNDYETLTGQMTVKFYKKEKRDWQLLETFETDEAGIEYGTFDKLDLPKLFTKKLNLL